MVVLVKKKSDITKVSGLHPFGTINVCTKFHEHGLKEIKRHKSCTLQTNKHTVIGPLLLFSKGDKYCDELFGILFDLAGHFCNKLHKTITFSVDQNMAGSTRKQVLIEVSLQPRIHS